jgi:hypothetical protein
MLSKDFLNVKVTSIALSQYVSHVRLQQRARELEGFSAVQPEQSMFATPSFRTLPRVYLVGFRDTLRGWLSIRLGDDGVESVVNHTVLQYHRIISMKPEYCRYQHHRSCTYVKKTWNNARISPIPRKPQTVNRDLNKVNNLSVWTSDIFILVPLVRKFLFRNLTRLPKPATRY